MKLTLDRLSKNFRNIIAVDNVSAELTPGVYGFLGANGAGKTTLMQMVCGIVAPTSGEVLVNGKNNLRLGEKFRDVLGYLPQEFGYTPGFSAKDFMLYIASIKGLDPHFAKRKTNDLLALVNLEDAANHKIRTFSGGMKRRLGIAQALLNDPEILILDEPTAGLDPKERAYFRNIISEMANGKIIIISTHIVSDIEYISDQILIMKKGRLILQGSAESLLPEVDGMVWNVTIPQNEWIHFEAHHSIVNSHNQGTVVEARVISNKRPTEEAVAVVPTLEDLYLKCFADEIEETR
ncbi:MAG: ABC transporter ATP-binding protein [Parasporobacterium sp.]|nr:ABC transporter ATP-binding protein [Parasporobacterium sp.]